MADSTFPTPEGFGAIFPAKASALRDHIAIEAMKVILAQHKFTPGDEPEDVRMVAEAAYIMAEAMLYAREHVE